ncbi:MAG: tRNA lysidine(34) synthetase TilS [Methylococcales bacterium]|nr:tRNA lysidine(34) synthetase TilS [Methylococcales bacterium]
MAYSGGVDSHVLLHALSQIKCQLPPIAAINVDHQLQAASAGWAKHCQKICAELNVPITCLQVDATPVNRESPEEAARKRRYEAWAELLQPGEVILLGQHLQDQAETVLLRLLRGAGPAGLSAIPERRALGDAQLLRPMLHVDSAQIHAYALNQQLDWVEDPSNHSLDYDRNYLRHQVLPLLKQRWPQVEQSFSRSAALCGEYERRQHKGFQADLQRCVEDGALCLEPLIEYTQDIQVQLVRYWLQEHTGQPVQRVHLAHVMSDLVKAKPDKQGKVYMSGGCVCRYLDKLFVLPGDVVFENPDVEKSWLWRGEHDLPLTGGVLSSRQVFSEPLTVTFRQGGEKIRLKGHAHRKQVKHLLQNAQVPPWDRGFLPFIWQKDQLIQVGERWVAEGFEGVISWAAT